MNIGRGLRFLIPRFYTQSVVRKIRIYSPNNEAKEATQPQVIEEKFDFEDLKVLERTERRKAQIEPFIKNVFLSKFDRELLAYPEILAKDEREDMDNRISRLEKVFTDPSKTEGDRISCLKHTKMYSAPEKLTNNGLAMLVTERLRYLETISSDIKLAKQLSEHWIGLEVVRRAMQPKEYDKLMIDLISGDQTISLCIRELLATRTSQADFRTTAALDARGIWKINGEKECIKSDGYLIVLAMLEANRLRAFLVKPMAEGVTHKDNIVSFMNTPAIPMDMITEADLSSILGLLRLDTAVLSHSLLRSAIIDSIKHVRGKFLKGKPLADQQTIRKRFAEALFTLYASESATFFTAGLLDGYVGPDAEVEMACCKNYIMQHGPKALLGLQKVPGMRDAPWFSSRMTQFIQLQILDEPEDLISQFIALNGLHHFGKMAAEEIKQIRNPLYFPGFMFKKILANRKQERDEPTLNLYLNHHLHPSLTPSSQILEYCVVRMRYACECLLARRGVEIQEHTAELERLSHAATDILVQTAVLARASRAYCIGLRNAEVEMKLSAAFCEMSRNRVRQNIQDIDDGEYLNTDFIKMNLGQKLLDTSSLLVERPIERTFW